MRSLPKTEMLEATRLTRHGRLREATALLLRTVRGSSGQPADSSDAAAGSARGPNLLNVLPAGESEDSVDTDRRSSDAASPGVRPRRSPAASVHPYRLPTLEALGSLRKSQPATSLPHGARFETRSFVNPAGIRDYKLYIPSTYSGLPVPLVVMLHGCTQTPDDFAAGTRMNELAEAETFLVAYPAQSQAANASKCWNWFNTSDQLRDQGEPSLIAGITREVMRDFAVNPRRVYIAGLSAGGAAAAVMGSTYPDLYEAIGVHSGLACGSARDIPSAFTAMRQGGGKRARQDTGGSTVRIIVFHGDRDATVHSINGDEIVERSIPRNDLEARTVQGTSADGVAYTRAIHSDASGVPVIEQWTLHGVGHAWSGGSLAGSFTDPRGPDASREMLRFFLAAQ